jgi:hypothetical protein
MKEVFEFDFCFYKKAHDVCAFPYVCLQTQVDIQTIIFKLYTRWIIIHFHWNYKERNQLIRK